MASDLSSIYTKVGNFDSSLYTGTINALTNTTVKDTTWAIAGGLSTAAGASAAGIITLPAAAAFGTAALIADGVGALEMGASAIKNAGITSDLGYALAAALPGLPTSKKVKVNSLLS